METRMQNYGIRLPADLVERVERNLMRFKRELTARNPNMDRPADVSLATFTRFALRELCDRLEPTKKISSTTK